MLSIVMTEQGPVLVDEHGRVALLSEVNPGVPTQARGRDLDSRMPHAQNAGSNAPGTIRMRAVRGPTPYDDAPLPKPTYRPLNGAAENNRGNTRVITLDAAALSTVVEVGSVVETSKNTGDDAESLIVTCGTTVLKAPSGANAAHKVEGILTFGIGGASFEAEFDWMRGVSFALGASFLRVAARVTYLSPADSVQLALAAAISYGPGPSGSYSPLRRTVELGTLAPLGVSTAQDVPAFASGVTLTSKGTTAPSLRLRLLSGTREATYDLVSRQNVSGQYDSQFTIPGWAETFTVENFGIVNAESVNAVFALAL